jgi:hypothetical protein
MKIKITNYLSFDILHKGKKIGFINAQEISRTKIYLNKIEIVEDERRKGFGRQAILLAEIFWAELDYKIVELDDLTSIEIKAQGQSASKSFWRKLGYRGRNTIVQKYIGK